MIHVVNVATCSLQKTRKERTMKTETYQEMIKRHEEEKKAFKTVKVTITRHEGPINLCDKPKTFSSFHDATLWMMSQDDTLPAVGYDKFKMFAEFGTGDTYEGRLDAKKIDCKNNDLDVKAHILETYSFYAGLMCPLHMKKTEYDSYIARETTEKEREELKAMIEYVRGVK